MGLLGVTLADLAARMNPLGIGTLISIGDGEDEVPTATAAAELARAEAKTVSGVPPRLQALLERIDGEKAVEDAEAGQETFYLFGGQYLDQETNDWKNGLPTGAKVDGVELYLDFGRARGGAQGPMNLAFAGGGREHYGRTGATPYSERTKQDRIPSTRYDVAKTTGLVTLIGWRLGAGQRVYADYFHTAAAKCEELRSIALDLAAAKLREILPALSEKFSHLEAIDKRASAQFMSLMDGSTGLMMFERIKLVNETRDDSATRGRRSLGGW